LHQLDAQAAFLNRGIDREILGEPPAHIFPEEERKSSMALLNYIVYRSKQLPLLWNSHSVNTLSSILYTRLSQVPIKFIRCVSDVRLYVAVYVDNILVVAPNSEEVTKIKEEPKILFEVTDMGIASCIIEWKLNLIWKIAI
jgi:Reverse transcriptase (RNA-dependent DNA polymerase)